jgi:hypothetical protein
MQEESIMIDVAFEAGSAFRDNPAIRYAALGVVGYRGDW